MLFIGVVLAFDMRLHMVIDHIGCLEVTHEPFALAAKIRILRSELHLLLLTTTFDMVVSLLDSHFFELTHSLSLSGDLSLTENGHLMLHVDLRHDSVIVSVANHILVNRMQAVDGVKIFRFPVEAFGQVKQPADNETDLNKFDGDDKDGQFFDLGPLIFARAVRVECCGIAVLSVTGSLHDQNDRQRNGKADA